MNTSEQYEMQFLVSEGSLLYTDKLIQHTEVQKSETRKKCLTSVNI